MAEEQKPVVISETPAVEPSPVTAAPVSTDKTGEAAVPAVKEPKKEDEPVAAGEAKEEKKEEKTEEKPVEPIWSGALGYKAPGLKNAFRYSKKYFWFGEDEPVPVQNLSHYLRGEKAEVAHPTAAWSSQTGKGLLYFVKHADEKANPAGVLNLSEATDLAKDGAIAFHFKLHGQKHSFEAQTVAERNGWFVACEKSMEEAKAKKDGILGSEGYKDELSKLGKPATLAATVAKEGSTPKKSTDAAPKPADNETVVAEGSTPAPARTGSSSSSSSSGEEKKKKKAAKSKSRSVSRGKRSSLFGGLLGKKDKAEEKLEDKKTEPEAKKEDNATAATEATSTAPVIPATMPATEESAKPTEEAAAAPVDDKKADIPAEGKKTEEKPKPTKRGSLFGNFYEKLKSPTHEKKESEVGPAAPAKEPEATAEVPKATEETPVAAAPVVAPVEGVAEAPKEEKKDESKPASTTPHKEKNSFSFGKFLGGAKDKVKSPSTEKSPMEAAKKDEPTKTDEAPAPVAAPVELASETPKEEKKDETTEAAAGTHAAKRGSIFGGLFRNASKAGKAKKEKEPAATPAKVEETPEPKEQTPAPVPEEKKEEETPAPASTEPAAIGDVVGDAVTVGQAPKSATQVSTSA